MKSFLFLWSFLQFLFVYSQYEGPWRNTLDSDGSCWLDSSCNRVTNIMHGGDWDLTYPYDSFPAFQRAYENGADAIKGDFRVNVENVGMVMHSSPIESYESLNCFGKKVEQMTTAQCESCKMALTNYTFISAPELLRWSQGKINVMFCVKLSTDVPRAITTLLEEKATSYSFLELKVGTYKDTVLKAPPHWSEVYYIVEVSSPDDIDILFSLDSLAINRAFLVEFQNFQTWPGDLTTDISRVRDRGLRPVGVTTDNSITATLNQHLELFRSGFLTAYTYNLENAVEARVQINTERGYSPP